MQLPSMIIYDHLWYLCMSTSWLNHLCWRRGLHGLGRHGLRLLAMGWGRRVLTWMLWNYFIVFLTRVIFVHGTSWYDCTFHIWTGNLILCFKIHDIRLGNSIIENRQYWSTFHLVSSDTNLKLIIKLCWAPQKIFLDRYVSNFEKPNVPQVSLQPALHMNYNSHESCADWNTMKYNKIRTCLCGFNLF